MEPWWSDQMAGMVGGIGGSILGILGGTLGTLGGILAPRGKCKTLILSLFAGSAVLGVCILLAGLVAVVLRQPWGVWYPLLLMGFLLSAVVGPLTFVMRNAYRQAEMRRLEAEELRRG